MKDIRKNQQKYEEAILVNKNKTDLFEIAEKLKPKDEVYVEGEKGVILYLMMS